MSLLNMIAASPVAAVLTDPRVADNPIVACNDAFVTLTGYARDEVLGRNCRFLSRDEPSSNASAALRDAIHTRQPTMVELVNYRKDGTRFRNAVMLAPIFDDRGEVEYFLGSQIEVSEGVAAGENRRAAALDRIAALSPRQQAVLLAMAAGKRNKQIAFELGVSERTVKMHRSALMKALGVLTASEAIRLAVEGGL